MRRCLLVLCMTVFLTRPVQASEELQTFLLSCAYGTGIGAVAGLTALAFTDSPGSNLNYVARGASLGLYAGMAVGLYWASQDQDHMKREDISFSPKKEMREPLPLAAAIIPTPTGAYILMGYQARF